MILFRATFAAIVFLSGVALATTAEAQTGTTLNVSARVIEECTIIAKSRGQLVRLARELDDPSIIRRCSKGVVSRVDKKRVKLSAIQPSTPLPTRRSLGIKRTSRSTPSRRSSDVVLVTVTY